MSQAIKDVAAERERQISSEGFSYTHDDQHTDGSLAMAAASYAMPHGQIFYEARYEGDDPCGWYVPTIWPKSWSPSWFKSRRIDPEDAPGFYRENLVKAGALIIAEIERLDRDVSGTPQP